MLALLGLAFFIQAGASSPPVPRLSERLYYADPYQQGVFSCVRRIAKKQRREFERRFGKRIAALERKDIAKWGADPGFEVVPLGHCSRDSASLNARFEAALRKFALDLSAIEREYR